VFSRRLFDRFELRSVVFYKDHKKTAQKKTSGRTVENLAVNENRLNTFNTSDDFGNGSVVGLQG